MIAFAQNQKNENLISNKPDLLCCTMMHSAKLARIKQSNRIGLCRPDAGEGLIVGVQAVACMLSFVRLIEM